MTEDVDEFLAAFLQKLNIWDVIYLDERGKNIQALATLEIRPIDRKNSLISLVRTDFSQGPINGDQWVFGKMVKETEVYIKISLGRPGSNTICISFHPSEYPMNYPFKQ